MPAASGLPRSRWGSRRARTKPRAGTRSSAGSSGGRSGSSRRSAGSWRTWRHGSKPPASFSGADVTARALADRIVLRDPRAIARAISLIENESPEGARLIGAIYPRTGRAYLIGVTGPPGAGKSTLVDRMTAELRRAGRTVGILAVDPTSPYSGG